ncbi:MAG: alanine--tRNA ligase [Anaerolineales bacterium]|nr:alanine--tRNA ligase [Anaerolineales bacterium]
MPKSKSSRAEPAKARKGARKTGAQIRKEFLDFFAARGHTVVPSASLVPGNDPTLLFTNAGMVQFKDVFLGTDKRPYVRAVDCQKCMRVAGKHNDLDEVGRDDTHHTFFEMLGNWSFGDYYKKEAIAWAWELLTGVWGLPADKLYATYFLDDQGDIAADEEAANEWKHQPGMDRAHVLPFGRKENFWEMADTGPCGPCSEIHLDRGEDACDKRAVPGHVCRVNGDCRRFTELWNLVFIQYNRTGPDTLEPLPAKHVDTGMGFDRLVAVLQDVNSNYRTDLLWPLIQAAQKLTGHSDKQREENFTAYRVIADHARAAAFLIADGVVPGNVGRNYICRMIIRRAALFGGKIGLTEPFLAQVAEAVVATYGEAYPELVRHREAVASALTLEERRFRATVDLGMDYLQGVLIDLRQKGEKKLPGRRAFDLYATYGLPLEITRDVLRESGMEVDAEGFRQAMEEHREVSGAAQTAGEMTGREAERYRKLLEELKQEGGLPENGVEYDPYSTFQMDEPILAILHGGQRVKTAQEGDEVEVILPRACLYIESGGQVADSGLLWMPGAEGGNDTAWDIVVAEAHRPVGGLIVLRGKVNSGRPAQGDLARMEVDEERRWSVMRNHTATHLLHAELRYVLGNHVRQAGSLVAPDRLRFDFTHHSMVSQPDLEKVERYVNEAILANYPVSPTEEAREEAVGKGAMALFGEKYGETVRTIAIGDDEKPFSYELCGGTHVTQTGDIGLFLIIAESSVASGVRRIEAVTGHTAVALVQERNRVLQQAGAYLGVGAEEVDRKVLEQMDELDRLRKENQRLRQEMAGAEFEASLERIEAIAGVPVLTVRVAQAGADTLRTLADVFRRKHASGIAAIGSVVDDKPLLIVTVSDDLTARGLRADELAKAAAKLIGGGGGGRPAMAQAGGTDPQRLEDALQTIRSAVKEKLG